MRAVIEWSYVLLSSQARLLFDRLSIFASSFSLDTATAVCADAQLPDNDMLELLSALIAQSMVMVDFSRGDARYHMLEATRQYALEQLDRARRARSDRQTPRAQLLRVAARLDRDWYVADERTWFRDAAAELDNCRAALEWALGEQHDVSPGRLIAARSHGSGTRSRRSKGALGALSARPSVEDPGRRAAAQFYLAEAALCGALGEYAASLAAAQLALDRCVRLDPL